MIGSNERSSFAVSELILSLKTSLREHAGQRKNEAQERRKRGLTPFYTGMDPTCLEVEVTESAVMENIDEAVGILHRIKSLGVKVALDDLGTGYSSLSSLTSLPLDKLKVDQSFVRRIERDQACRTVTEAIIGLGRSLRLNVHGEGIESEDALLYLEAQGCNQAQGYWFSRPLAPAQFENWYYEHWGKDSGVDGWERVKRIWAPKG